MSDAQERIAELEARLAELNRRAKVFAEGWRISDKWRAEAEDNLAKAMAKLAYLEKAASIVSSKGAETGPQWAELSIAIFAARSVIAELKVCDDG